MSFDAALAAGPYNLTHGGVAVGLLDETPGLNITPLWEILNRSHTYGGQRLGAVYLGTEVDLYATIRLWNSTSRSIIWPYNGTLGVPGTVGRDGYDMASAWVFSAVAGTPAATAGPASVTASKAIINSTVPITLGNEWRVLPVVMMTMLDSSGNPFSTT